MDDEAGERRARPLCLTCLRRESRPGSVYCSRLCRVLHALRVIR